MENKKEKKEQKQNQAITEQTSKSLKKRVSKTWAAAMKLKGSLIVNDPKFLL